MKETYSKKCLVIGSRSSLGKEISEVFKSHGYQVIGTSREVNTDGKNAEYYLDLTEPDSFENLSAKLGKLDICIYCSGLLLGKALNQYPDQDLDLVFYVNVIGLINLLKIIENKINPNGHVLVLSSIAAFNGSFDPVYASSKAALTGFIRAMAKHSRNGITFNCIAPGLIKDTHMYNSFSKNDIERHIEETPLKVLANITDVAKVCFDICQPHWSHLTGQVIHLNGGRYV